MMLYGLVNHKRLNFFWATGLNKVATLCVKKASWPGQNKMGKLLAKLKEELLEAQKMQLRSGNHSSQKQGANQEENGKVESDYNYED